MAVYRGTRGRVPEHHWNSKQRQRGEKDASILPAAGRRHVSPPGQRLGLPVSLMRTEKAARPSPAGLTWVVLGFVRGVPELNVKVDVKDGVAVMAPWD